MSAVDERIVRMEFDNKQFEKNIKQSIKSLDDLDKQLGLVGDDDALDNIDKKSKKIDFSHMLGGLDKVSHGFNVLESIAFGVLTRIGSKITDIVSQYAGMLTFKQVGAGFDKYESKMEAMQTMMNATANTWEKEAYGALSFAQASIDLGNKAGETYKDITSDVLNLYREYVEGSKTLQEVSEASGLSAKYLQRSFEEIDANGGLVTQIDYISAALNRLNWFTDETSYSYSDLVTTASQFTSYGYGLNEAVSAVQGIALWAARAGKNAQDATIATRNMSQAVAAGVIRIQDWQSIERANMNTVEFETLAMESAVALGTLTKEFDNAGNAVYYAMHKTSKGIEKVEVNTKNFRTTLSENWFTGEVFMDTMQKYNSFTDELYGFTEALGITAYEGLDAIDAFKEAADDTESFESWGRAVAEALDLDPDKDDISFLEDYKYALESLASEENEFGRKAFEAGQMAKTFKDVIDGIKDAASTTWMNIFEQLFGNLEKAADFWGEVYDYFEGIFVSPVKHIQEILEGWNNIELETGEVVQGSDLFRQSILNILDAVTSLADPINEVFFGGQEGAENAARSLYNFTLKLRDFTESLIPSEDVLTGFANILRVVKDVLGGVFSIIKPIFGLFRPITRLLGTLGKVLFRVINAFAEVFSSSTGSLVESVADTIGRAVDWIADKLDIVSTWIDETFSNEAIREVFGYAADFIVNAWNLITDAISAAWDYISPLLPTFDEITSSVSNLWNLIKQYLPTWDSIIAGLQATWQLLKQVGEAIWTFLQPYVQKLGDAFSRFWEHLSNFFTGFVEAEDKIQYLKDTVQKLIDKFNEWRENSEFLKGVRDVFNGIKDAIVGFFDAIPEGTGGKIASIAFLAASFLLLFKVFQAADDFAWYIGKFGKAFNKFARMFQLIGFYLIIKSITDLCKALQDLTKVTNPAQMYVGMGFVVLMMGALVAVAYLIRQFTKDMSKGDMTAFAVVLAVLSLTLLAIAKTLEKVANVNLEGFGWKVLAIILIMASIVGAAFLLSKFVGKFNWKTMLSIVAIPVALLLAATAFSMLGKLSTEEFNRAYNVILLFVGAILLTMLIGSILKRGTQALSTIGSMVLKMALAFLAVSIALKIIQGIKMNAQMIGSIIMILAVLTAMAVIPIVVSKLSKKFGSLLTDISIVQKSLKAMSLALLAITASIVIIAWTMNRFGVSADDIVGIGYTLLLLMAGLSVMIVAMGFATRIASDKGANPNSLKKTSKALRSVVLAVVALAGVMALLAHFNLGMDNQQTQDVLATMGILMLMLAGLMLFVGLMNGIGTNWGKANTFNAKPIIGIVVAMLAMAGILVLLNKLELGWNNAKPIIGTMLALAAIIAGLMIACGYANDLANSWGGKFRVGPIIAVVMAIIAIVYALVLLATVGDEGELRSAAWSMFIVAGAMAALMVAFGVMSELINKSKAKGNKGFNKALAIIASMIVLVLAIAGAIWVVSQALATIEKINVRWGTIFQIIALLGILGAVFGAVAVVNNLTGGGPTDILAVSAMVVAIAGAMWIMGKALDQVGKAGVEPKKLWTLFAILALLGVIFGAIGAIAGPGALAGAGLIVAISVGFVLLAVAMQIAQKALPGMAKGLAMLFNVIQNSELTMKQIGIFFAFSVVLIVFSAACVAVSVAAVVMALAFYIAGAGLKAIAEGLNELGPAMVNFTTSGERLKEINSMLLKFGAAGIVAGIAAVILAVALILVAAAILVAAVAALVLAAAFLVAVVALAILTVIIHGLTDGLQYFAQGLYNIAWMMPVVAQVGGQLALVFLKMGAGAIVLGVGLIFVGAGFLLIAVSAYIFASALSVATIAIAALASGIGLLVEGVAMLSDVFTGGDMSSKVEGFTAKIQEGGDKITETLRTMKEEMKEAGEGITDNIFGGGEADIAGGGGGILDKLLGNVDIESAKEKMSGFLTGEGGIFDFSQYGASLSGENNPLNDFMNQMMGDGAAGIDFSQYGDQFNTGLFAELSGGADGLDVEALSAKYGGKLGEMDIGPYIEDSGAGQQLANSFITGVDSVDTTPAGEELAGGVVTGIGQKNSAAKSAGQTLGNNGNSGASSTRSSWVSTGGNLGAGLVEGIKSKLQAAYNAGNEIAKKANQGAKDGAQVSSPSKVFMEIGGYMVEGLVIGINNGTNNAVRATTDMALATVGAATEILADTILNDYTNPVIRPTLDLSNVAAGAAGISSMFGNQTVGVNGQYANGTTPTGNTVYNYTQNNYSPKALDRVEIYRQTKNQINGVNVLASV